jgi:hypothetical protein
VYSFLVTLGCGAFSIDEMFSFALCFPGSNEDGVGRCSLILQIAVHSLLVHLIGVIL